MFRSLRFRLPALFLAGIALAGLVASLIALRLFQDYTRNTTLSELSREAQGLAQLYVGVGASRARTRGRRRPRSRPRSSKRQRATVSSTSVRHSFPARSPG